ncbi:MAG: hypothetical protein E7519_03990 [Ruminococcaceae bacterium]|nr:hypothetical protein [Oscillospiraceae bacterium]
MNTKNNQRFQDNEKKIEECLVSMLKTQDISLITVRSICQAANINRSTFYSHYQDIYDLLDKLEKKMNACLIGQYDTVERNGSFFMTAEFFVPFLNFIKCNQSFYRATLNKRKSFPIETGFEPLWNTIVKPYSLHNGITEEEEMMYYFVFYQAGVTMCLKRWVDQGCQVPVEQICSYFLHCLANIEKQ